MKVIAYSFNGVQAIESNSEFTKEALAAAGGKKIITMCEAGGTMKPSVNFPFVSVKGNNFTVLISVETVHFCHISCWQLASLAPYSPIQ